SEWKVEKDKQTDLHRHLSHLVGLYPSYSIASYPEGGSVVGLSKSELLKAAATSLKHRGDGRGPDADAGWEKVWRAACWAQLGDGEKFYSVFKYAVDTNFGHNLFSLYEPRSYNPIFQIDANLGVPGVVMNALLQAPDTSSYDSPLVITILPALPKAWSARGSVKGARVRGGIGISFAWRDGRPYDVILRFDRMKAYQSREVNIVYNGRIIDSFVGEAGMVRKVNV
ncbi:glycoside hydrolase family 95 protein, partial [Tulasnella calospora MUT 4182]